MENNNDITSNVEQNTEDFSSSYREEVESTILSDTIDTTERDSNTLPDESESETSDTSEYDSDEDSATSYFDSDEESDISELSEVGLDTFGAQPVMPMLPSAHNILNNPVLDPTYRFQLLEHGRMVTGDPMYGFNNASCRVHLSSKDSKYLEEVIRVHNGLQDLLVKMLNDAVEILGLDNPKLDPHHYTMSDFNLSHLGNFISQLCTQKRLMIKAMDIVNRLYNELTLHYMRNPDERTPEGEEKFRKIHYNWNLFLLNYLPLVPTQDDKEFYASTGKHRQLKTSDLLPDISQLGGDGEQSTLQETNQTAQDIMRRVKSFIDGKSSDETGPRIDTMPLSAADPKKRSSLKFEGMRKVEKSLRTKKSLDTRMREIEQIDPTDKFRANDPLDVVQRIQNLDGSNNISNVKTVPDFTVEYSDVDVDSPLREYVKNMTDIRGNVQKGELNRILLMLQNSMEYDYSHLTADNLKLIPEPFDLTRRSRLEEEKEKIEQTLAIGETILDVYKPKYETIHSFLASILRDHPIKPNSVETLPELLDKLKVVLDKPPRNKARRPIDPDNISTSLKSLATQVKGMRDRDRNPSIIEQFASQTLKGVDITDALFSVKYEARDKGQKTKPTDLQSITLDPRVSKFRDLFDEIVSYNNWLASKNPRLEKIEQIETLRHSLEADSPIVPLEVRSKLLRSMDTDLLISLKILDSSRETLDTDMYGVKGNREKIEDLTQQIAKFKINEILDTSDIVLKEYQVGEAKKVDIKTDPSTLEQMFGGSKGEELQRSLESAERDMRKISHSLFDKISLLDTSKANYNELHETMAHVKILEKGLNEHLELITSVAGAIQDQTLHVVRYLRLPVLQKAREDFRRIVPQTDSYNVSLQKLIKVVDRIEELIGDSDQNVVEISLEDQYMPSFIHLVILYFMILCISSENEVACLSEPVTD